MNPLLNPMIPNPLTSMQIVIVPGGVWAQARSHTRRPWMREAYHKRIQKKWLKRFGKTWVETLARGQVITAGRKIMCRQEDYEAIKRALAA